MKLNSMIDCIIIKNLRPLDHQLGLYCCDDHHSVVIMLRYTLYWRGVRRRRKMKNNLNFDLFAVVH